MAQNYNDIPAQPLGLPRFVEVGKEKNYEVEILEYGKIMPHDLWSTNEAIFPRGFRSRVSYWSVVEPNKCCNYISETLDGGKLCPLFMVSVEENPSEVFIHIDPKRCWELVVEKVNIINKNFYEEKKKRGTRTNHFKVQKQGSIDGLEMFGLSEASVLQALEALDTGRVSEYCRLKDKSLSSEARHQNPLVRRTVPISIALHSIFKKANSEELRALEMVFRDASSSSNISTEQEVVGLLSKEITSREGR